MLVAIVREPFGEPGWVGEHKPHCLLVPVVVPALACIGQDACHLILLDVLLSGKDGRDIVKHLKSQDETRHIPVIMFSAHPSAEETARACGAEDFVAKPFEIDVLLAKIATYL